MDFHVHAGDIRLLKMALNFDESTTICICVDCCFLIPEFGYAGNFWLHPRNAMTLLAGCRAMPKKIPEKVRCDECKMTIPILLSL